MALQETTPNDTEKRAVSADRAGENTGSAANRSDLGRSGVSQVRTSDPDIASPEAAAPPDRAVSYQTSQLAGPSAVYPFGHGGGVEARPEDANGRKHGGPRQKKHKKHAPSSPGWPALVITGVLALACGAGGAWAYSAFGASQSDRRAAGKDGKGGKSGDKQSGDSEPQASDTGKLKKQVEQLADGMDELGTRIDRLNQAIQEARTPVPQFYPGTSRIERMAPANDEAPPVPHALQTQLTVLQRKVEQMADLPARVEELERRITELQEATKLPVASHAQD